MAHTRHKYSPAQLAKAKGHGRDFIVALIKADELEATDERGPGKKLPRYRVTEEAWQRWEMTRRVTPTANVPVTRRSSRALGVLGRHRLRRRMKAAAVGR